MDPMQKLRISVVGAVIADGEGRIFCALRSRTMSNPNLWEFPGGKIEAGEGPEDALRRELEEEFGCIVEPEGEIFCDTEYEYDHAIIRLLTLRCPKPAGPLHPKEHAAGIWLAPEYLESLRWAPADIPAVKRLASAPLPCYP